MREILVENSAASSTLSAQGLTRRFGTSIAVRDLNLNVARGEIHGLVGANGGGKSTILRILAGVLRPTTGSASINGLDVVVDASRVRRQVGYMPQRVALHDKLTVFENLRFRAALYGVNGLAATVARVAAEFNVSALLNTRVAALSGGQARLTMLAASVLHAPRALLLDEPTAGLDAHARHVVWRHLTRLAQDDAAIIVATHDLIEAERCARVTVLSGGRVCAQGKPADLIAAVAAEAYLVTGKPSLLLAAAHATRPGVFAAYPFGAGIRILAARGVLTPRDFDSSCVPMPLTFEDATVVLSCARPSAC